MTRGRQPCRRDDVFLKSGPAAALPMFEAEAAGLAVLAASGEVRVPEVYAVEIKGNEARIVMERLALTAPGGDHHALFGLQLARLHRHIAGEYGWERDNMIGPTPQCNRQSADWTAFFREQRLQYQLELAAANGYGGELQRLGAELCARLEGLLRDYQPPASLLHGDLWGGNWGVADGVPVTFDPAVYYGDRETDLAMTRLFGGFNADFYRAYETEWPLEAGSEERVALYQLYHVLNHLNLFGQGYLAQAMGLLRQLLQNREDPTAHDR